MRNFIILMVPNQCPKTGPRVPERALELSDITFEKDNYLFVEHHFRYLLINSRLFLLMNAKAVEDTPIDVVATL